MHHHIRIGPILCFSFFVGCIMLSGCSNHSDQIQITVPDYEIQDSLPYVVVLGNVQDAGSPHAGCKKDCCKDLFENPDPLRMVTCLGIVDPIAAKTYLIEASPDLPRQMKYLSQEMGIQNNPPDGIFLTHGHIGHYSGLMFLGKESMSANQVPVYAMPRMSNFLKNNGPWDQLVKINNIEINELKGDDTISLSEHLSISPFLVPHRGEYSETVGYRINGPNKSIIFIPDIDKWNKWSKSIYKEVHNVDYAIIDATFYDEEEINYRDISEIPHPFVIETMAIFDTSAVEVRNKIQFIHLNHTNPLLRIDHPKTINVLRKGYQVASFGKIYNL